MSDRSIEILDAGDEMRDLVRACEISGQRTVLTRDSRAVAILVAYDEYLALRETIAIGTDDALRAQMALAEEQAARGGLLAIEDLLEA